MTLLLTVPAERLVALTWVADLVFKDMLRIPVRVNTGSGPDVALSMNGATLTMRSLFPVVRDGAIDMAVPLPALPLAVWDIARSGLDCIDMEAGLPVLFGLSTLELSEKRIDCGIDILGSIFFMLSRYEEIVVQERDQHDRFPGGAALASRAGFLYRPVVDEYVEALWAMMSRLWPGLERKRRAGSLKVSCDIDRPFDWTFGEPGLLLRSLGADVLQRRDFPRVWQRLRNLVHSRRGDYRYDPYYTFDWYLETCERQGHRAAFYFIPERSAGVLDGTYDLTENRVLALIRKLADHGHELGVHGSYNSFRDSSRIVRERGHMIAACGKAGVNADLVGNRQHYLRWDSAQTPDHLDDAGFQYDTSGTFADRPGFRYGTSFPFAMWSWRRHAPLRIIQRPLVLMECSVLDQPYLGMRYSDEALDLMQLLKRNAMRHGGDFTMLWHNSNLMTDMDREFFVQMLR